MTEIEFKSLAQQGYNRIPLIAEAFADLETPLSLYLKLVGSATPDRASCSNRWSAASASAATRSSACRRARCCAPAAFAPRSSPTAWWSRRTRATRSTSSPTGSSASGWRCAPACRASAAASRATSATTRCATSSRGWRRPGRTGGIDTPDILLLQCEELAVIDNLSGRLYLIVYADPTAPEAWFRARRRLAELTDKLRHRRHRAAGQARPGAAGRARIRQGRLPRGGAARQGIRRRRRHDAGADRAAAEEALHRVAAQPLPGAALAEPVAVHVLLRLRRLPGDRRLARDPGAPGAHAGGRQGDDPAARGNAAARRDAGAGQGARGRAAWATRRSAPST